MEQMRRTLPCLPGFNFDDKLGKTKFHKSQYFDKIHDGVYYLSEKPNVGEHSRYPSNYSYIDEPRIPPWIAYDGQRLMFQAFFQQTVQERLESYQIRLVTISFFLEDGTLKIVEPAISNSGLEQGVLVRRQRIPLPDPAPYRFYDILDLNIGKEPEIFGRVYKIVNCDKFTRIFLNRMGIPVPDPIELPCDPYIERRNVPTFPKKPNRKIDTLGKFLNFDRKVLRFYGYWDDRDSEYGIIHDLEIRYYLADDTLEIKEILPKNSGREGSSVFIKRMKIPKFFTRIESVGSSDPFTVLNVLGASGAQSYFIPDALNAGEVKRDYYKDSDLTIGTSMNVFGREVVITDLDPSTKSYYSEKYGIEEFTPLEKPGSASDYCSTIQTSRPPPYNGFGSYEDSLGNCFRIIPKPPKMDYARFAAFDKQGYDSKVLSFRGGMISKIPENCSRQFIIQIYLMDNTVSIFEYAPKNTGFTRSLFQKRMEVPLPGREVYPTEKPRYFEPHHFYIGAGLNLGGFQFYLTSADEYTLRYMELNCDKFSRANAALIMSKIREGLKPCYKQFVEEVRPVTETDGIFILPYEAFRESLMKHLKDKGIVEHEIITVARRYGVKRNEPRDTREYLRSLIHTELTRFLWNNLDRLAEDIHHWNPSGTGFLPPSDVYKILRGCRLPLDAQLITCLLNHLGKNPEGEIDCQDLLDFMNVKLNPTAPAVPAAISTLPWWNDKDEDDCCPALNWTEFLKDLNIKEDDPASAADPQ
ncbi:EF-hand domain-containing family member C2-like [Diachasmimorpha longicaudata]|uniref:EF-hand domain-containing family member C2-like n=1 Tax=Diachasmimorpha longicaudata TaxID=58733 RepID=UPI0030B87102